MAWARVLCLRVTLAARQPPTPSARPAQGGFGTGRCKTNFLYGHKPLLSLWEAPLRHAVERMLLYQLQQRRLVLCTDTWLPGARAAGVRRLIELNGLKHVWIKPLRLFCVP